MYRPLGSRGKLFPQRGLTAGTRYPKLGTTDSNQPDTPMTLYHATDAENKDAILENGLLCRASAAMTYGEQYQGKGVWMFASADQAEEFAADNFFCGYVIFAIDASGLDLIADAEYDEGASWIATECVGAERITMHSEAE